MMAWNFGTVLTLLIDGMSASFSAKASSFFYQVFYQLTSSHVVITYFDSLLYYVFNAPVSVSYQAFCHSVLDTESRFPCHSEHSPKVMEFTLSEVEREESLVCLHNHTACLVLQHLPNEGEGN
jgi:hypothetical protein